MKEFSLASKFSLLHQEQQKKFLAELSDQQALDLEYNWDFWSRPSQRAPIGAWRIWLLLAGRGFGKSRCGAEFVREKVGQGYRRIALIGRTAADVRDVMIEGESGILAKSHPDFRPVYEPSKRRLTWPDDKYGKGAIATAYSADKPDQLRGPQHDLAWGDEFAAWRYIDDTWSNADFGLRLGLNPCALLTTTPRPIKQVRDLLVDPSCVVTRGSTFDNAGNLPANTLDAMARKYGGTRLGRQELYAEILSDNPGALWKRADIEASRTTVKPEMVRIVVGVDPAVSSNEGSDETGIIVAGLGVDGDAYILDDASMKALPAKWARAVIASYSKFEADRVVGEVNNGGDLVEANIRSAEGGREIAYKKVHASRGKRLRAEPVSTLYEQGRVHHLGAFAELEDQMCQWDPSLNEGSPDRLDALVWALTDLMLGEEDPNASGRIFKGRRSTR